MTVAADQVRAYLQGTGPRPTWLDAVRANVRNAIDYAKGAIDSVDLGEFGGYEGYTNRFISTWEKWFPTNIRTPTTLGPDAVPPVANQVNNTNNAENLSPEDRSAKAAIVAGLAPLGLEGLADEVWTKYKEGVPIAQLMLDIRAHPVYKTRYPAMSALIQKGRSISESQYIDLERSYKQVMQEAALPAGFYDSPDDFAAWIGGEVSPREVQSRVDLYRQAVYDEPPEVRAELERRGIGEGGMIAYYINPTKALPVLQNELRSSEIGASAKRTGYGELPISASDQLALQGVTQEQAQAGFNQLALSQELFNPLPGEVSPWTAGDNQVVGQEEQLGATFSNDAKAQRRISRIQRARQAQFEGGGSFATTQGGITGLASANK